MALIKYPNRRIYDTVLKRYFTIGELRERLIAGETVKCKTDGHDVTDEVLIGILAADIRNGEGPEAEHLRRFIQEYNFKRAA